MNLANRVAIFLLLPLALSMLSSPNLAGQEFNGFLDTIVGSVHGSHSSPISQSDANYEAWLNALEDFAKAEVKFRAVGVGLMNVKVSFEEEIHPWGSHIYNWGSTCTITFEFYNL